MAMDAKIAQVVPRMPMYFPQTPRNPLLTPSFQHLPIYPLHPPHFPPQFPAMVNSHMTR